MKNKDINDSIPAKSWRDLFRTIKKLRLPWFWIILGLSVNLLMQELMLRLPDTTAELLLGDMSGAAMVKAIIFYVELAVVSFLMIAGQVQAETYSTCKARETVWKKMLGMKMDHYDENDPSDMMSTITNDVSNAVFDSVNIMIYLIPDIYYIVMALIKINQYHWVLTASCLAILPLKFLYACIMGKMFYRSSAVLNRRVGTLTAFLADRINHLPLIKAYTNEKEELAKGKSTCNDLLKANMKIVSLGNASTAITSVLDILQKFIVVVVAVLLLQKGLITITMWLAFFLFSQNLFTVMDNSVNIWLQIKGIHGKFVRVIDVMDGEDEATPDAASDFPEKGDIRFENVTFTYPMTDTPALKNISFCVPHGTSLAIVGLCGSGKTTSISLLERFYQPQEGKILIGDVNIRDISLYDFRRRFSYVQQGADIFSGTIKEALTYGIDRSISDDEILQAAKLTGFAEYISICEKGLDTDISSGGMSLSGGQSQRLVITREVLRNGDYILMDEPTAALDVRISGKIQAMMDELFKNKTRILVTHDLRLATGYDKIIVMNNGEAAGMGTHEELMRDCELYREMHGSLETEAAL